VVVAIRSRGARSWLVLGMARIPPPWSGRLGAAVILRGGAAAAVLSVPLFVIPVGHDERVLAALEALLALIVGLPVALLAYRHLLRPLGVGLADGFGLRQAPGGARRLVWGVLAVIALGLAGDWAIGTVGDAAGAPGHWTEWFDEGLAFGGGVAMIATLAGAVVIAPVTEEVVFRGVLFVTLRRRLAWPLAAALSACAFALLHGYGPVGFASVWWSGFVWAWAYERTRSLWPAIAAHAFGNLWASVSLLLLFRA
jgi:membrane protease YdiL (CAAX protease family)